MSSQEKCCGLTISVCLYVCFCLCSLVFIFTFCWNTEDKSWLSISVCFLCLSTCIFLIVSPFLFQVRRVKEKEAEEGRKIVEERGKKGEKGQRKEY